MKLSDIATLYGALPQAIALRKTLSDNATNTIWLKNIKASAVPLLFASVAPKAQQVFVSFFLMPTKLAISIMI